MECNRGSDLDFSSHTAPTHYCHVQVFQMTSGPWHSRMSPSGGTQACWVSAWLGVQDLGCRCCQVLGQVQPWGCQEGLNEIACQNEQWYFSLLWSIFEMVNTYSNETYILDESTTKDLAVTEMQRMQCIHEWGHRIGGWKDVWILKLETKGWDLSSVVMQEYLGVV